MVTKLVRKTAKMEAVQYKFGMDIEMLILQSISNCNGEQRCASNQIGIAEATLSRWIHELNLTQKVSQLRKMNGLPPSNRDLRIRNDDGKSVIEVAIRADCVDCGIRYVDLQVADIQGVMKTENELTVAVRDEKRIKHRYVLDPSSV